MVVTDTDIFITALRGNAESAKHLSTLKGKAAVSITELELFVGAKTKLQKQQAETILEPFDKLKINNDIYLLAKRLLKEHNSHNRSLYMPDALIAATTIYAGASLPPLFVVCCLLQNKKDSVIHMPMTADINDKQVCDRNSKNENSQKIIQQIRGEILPPF
jgi:predicted nucleic acid-binding protein